MILSRLVMNPRSREAACDLADCQELHRTILSAFPAADSDSPRERFGILFRVEYQAGGATIILVQSREMPNWDGLPRGYLSLAPESKDISESWNRLQRDIVLRFRLRANPTRKIGTKTGPDGAKSNGKRVEVRTEDDQINWLRRKAADGGFEIVSVRTAAEVPDVRVGDEGKIRGFRAHRTVENGKRPLTFASVLFEGKLRMTDAEKFRVTLEHGIGSAKAYGFGLLSIGPA